MMVMINIIIFIAVFFFFPVLALSSDVGPQDRQSCILLGRLCVFGSMIAVAYCNSGAGEDDKGEPSGVVSLFSRARSKMVSPFP